MLLTAAPDCAMGKSELFHSDEEDYVSGRGSVTSKLGSPRPLDDLCPEDSGEETNSSETVSEQSDETETVQEVSEVQVQQEQQEQKVQETVPHQNHKIQDVWHQDVRKAFACICQLVRQFPFVAMDTEFPGVVNQPEGCDPQADEYGYLRVKCNVDNLRLIQLGLTLHDHDGRLPDGVCTWQFNFEFNLHTDMWAEDSIALLQSAGIDFEKHSTHGVQPEEFAELLIGSGLVLMENVTWLTFHSSYDFGYLLYQLLQQEIPSTEKEFSEYLKLYFPNVYDIKYLMQHTNLVGGLQYVANCLGVERIGQQHQAGSDSLLTGQVFFRIYQEYFSNRLDNHQHCGQIYGFQPHHQPNHCQAMLKHELDESVLCAEMEELHFPNPLASPMRDH